MIIRIFSPLIIENLANYPIIKSYKLPVVTQNRNASDRFLIIMFVCLQAIIIQTAFNFTHLNLNSTLYRLVLEFNEIADNFLFKGLNNDEAQVCHCIPLDPLKIKWFWRKRMFLVQVSHDPYIDLETLTFQQDSVHNLRFQA